MLHRGHKSDIIFASLPAYFDGLASAIQKSGRNVYYLELSSPGQSAEAERRRADVLRNRGIVPLPLEEVQHLDGIRANLSDPENKLRDKNSHLASDSLLEAFEKLFPNIAQMTKKLRAILQTVIGGQIFAINQVNCWAKTCPRSKVVLIYPNVYGFLVFDLAPNVRLVVVPIDVVFKGVLATAQAFCKLFRTIVDRMCLRGPTAISKTFGSRDVSLSKIVFVTHKGLDYGPLFQKTLFYSDSVDSELYPEKLLHFDYSDYPSPSEKIRWVCLGSEQGVFLANPYHALVAIGRGIIRVRSLSQIIGLLLLSRFYAAFISYSKKLGTYPELQVALIDYEILCPKALLLAFESRNIMTVAVQERFVVPFYRTSGTILHTYLCGSEYIAEVINQSSSYCVDRCIPVGQYKSDNLIAARQLPPPQILETPIAQGRKIVTALGFHTHMDWYNSQSDPMLNWTAHRHFLEEMIQLSKDISNVFVVFRFKMVNWISLPVFAKAIQEIESSENMTISMDYEKSFFSYDLCSHSHLVIAKHTSLADECLSVGIPVLFHEYTHNTERLVADAFDYSPTRIMCFNYKELLERSRIILSGDAHVMTSDYEHLKNIVFGGLGDGNVRERIHAHINSLLEEHP